MRVWRLSGPQHAATALDGEGARRFGGRWNARGTPVVYAAATLSLAALEVLVHVTAAQARMPFAAIEIDVPDALAIEPPTPLPANWRDDPAPASTVAVGAAWEAVASLPADWRDDPAPASTVALGAAWVSRGDAAVLRVPSVVVPLEHNVVLNVGHADFAQITLVRTLPFAFDTRLLA